MLVAALAVTRWAAAPSARAAGSQDLRDRALLGTVLSTPGVMVASLTNAVLVAIQTGVLVFLYPLYLVNRAGVGPGAVGVLVSLTVLGRLSALWFGGGASDRWGRLRVLVPGLLVYAALLATVTSVTHWAWLGCWSFAIGAASGFVAALPTALVGDRLSGPHQGVAIGWLRTMADSGQIVGPLVMGALADAVDLSAPFVAAAALLIVAAWQCRRAA